MNRQQVIEYYSNEFVIKQLLSASKDREVAGAFWDGTYDQRPNILQFPSDIVQMAKKGVTSFHFSVEHWSNPMSITTAESYDKLRKGWDVIIDIDSKMSLDESKIAARLVCELLEKYGIRNYGIKFSGRRGFHIVMPWIMFPKTIDYKSSEKFYPLVPRVVSRFIRKKIKHDLMDELVKTKGAKNLFSILSEVPEKISPYFFVEIEKDWGSRHMFRAPYSLNEKTWLVSIPITLSQLRDFDPKQAEPKHVIANANTYASFFTGEENEAQDLLTAAMDWYATIKKEEPKQKPSARIVWEKKITEEYFPPCVKNILAGLANGRKRSIFTLVNFLRMANWSWPEIEQKIFEWNEKNKPPLPRSIVLGQLRWGQSNQRTTANCPPDGDLFYTDTGICKPDKICTAGGMKIAIKNPVVYPFRLMKIQRKLKPRRRGYSCGVCNKEFKNMRALNMHKSRTHGYVFDV
jgi:hypothetical protein